METAGEERIRAVNSLQELEEAALLLREAAESPNSESISVGFPARISGILNELTALSSREDGERLLAIGVSLWNAVIALEGRELDKVTSDALVRVRHVAADCIFMSTTVLGGISARYNIDDLNLMKFYLSCGQKYATDLSDIDMADICYAKASEFADAAKKDCSSNPSTEIGLANAIFELQLGRAECSWDKGDSETAEKYVDDASKYLSKLPGEHEFLASVEYNFGLFKYQEKDTKKALQWLQRSIDTRNKLENKTKDAVKQARTMRLAGVCLLALQEYDESLKMMDEAQRIHDDSLGGYLKLKLSIITNRPNAIDILIETISNDSCGLDIAMACISLFGDAMRPRDAIQGYERLFERFRSNHTALVCSIGPRYFEILTTTGEYGKAIEVLRICISSMAQLTISPSCVNAEQEKTLNVEECRECQRARWSALTLSMGSNLVDKKDFHYATLFLCQAIEIADVQVQSSIDQPEKSNDDSHWNVKNVVLQNEADVCRLTASCALCAIKVAPNPALGDDANPSPGHAEMQLKKQHMCSIARVHAERAKTLQPYDFAPRLLLFRVELMEGRHEAAASILEVASNDITSFDPCALAEAACAARDTGTKKAVIAALQCILRMDPLRLRDVVKSTNVKKGFYGTILISCVGFIIRTDNETADCKVKCEMSKEDSHYLLETMQFGLRGIQVLGDSAVFGADSTKRFNGILFLARVAWNQGRELGKNLEYDLWVGFFCLCHDFAQMLPRNPQSLHMQRMSRLMGACGHIESSSSSIDDCKKAKEYVKEARDYSSILKELVPSKNKDPIEGLLFTLEARACVRFFSLQSLSSVVKAALTDSDLKVGVLEQLAAICHSYKPNAEELEGPWSTEITDLKAALLSKAVEIRACEENQDMTLLAMAVRENLIVEFSRGTAHARILAEFRKAVGIVIEHEETYPPDEIRWILASGWDRAQMTAGVGLIDEARQWCAILIQLTTSCALPSVYRPKILSFKETLDEKITN